MLFYFAIYLYKCVDTVVETIILSSPIVWFIWCYVKIKPISQPLKWYHLPSDYFSDTAKRSLSGSAATITYVSGKALSANIYIF